ncbi:PH domain-containing protein [Streptomyces phaeochromogenes]|uniref:PH domain-containing protein n=1 Tax=Streptomyces phaeochromogenes TaxID=1923 RepID=UPI0036B663F1
MSEYGGGDQAGDENGAEDGNGNGRGIEREYRRRKKPPRGLLFLMAFALANFLLQMGRHFDTLPTWLWACFAVLVLTTLGWATLFMLRGRTRVGPDGIAVRTAVSERKRSWHDIYDIRVEPTPRSGGPSARRYVTLLYGNDGRRLGLPHLDDWQLDDPHTEVADLLTAAARHRGMTWDRRPEVEARIRRRAGHRKAWERAWTGAIVVLLCMLALVLGLIVVDGEAPVVLLLVCVPLGSFAVLAALLNWRWESQVPRSLRESEPPPAVRRG